MFANQRFDKRRVKAAENMKDREDGVHAARGDPHGLLPVIRGGDRPIGLAQSDTDDFARGLACLFLG